MTVEDAVAGIAATVTGQGLKCTAVRDDAAYPGSVPVPAARIADLRDRLAEPAAFRGEWNYAIPPAPRPAPEPDPEPGPGPEPGTRVPHEILNHPALTGIPAADLDAAAAALEAPFEARLSLRSHRKRPRKRAGRSRNRRLGAAECLIALALRSHLGLTARVAGVLLGVDSTTVSAATVLARDLLSATAFPFPVAPPPGNPPRSPAELLAYAAAAGIPLTIPENRYTMPDRFRTPPNWPPRDTSKTGN